MIQNEIMTLLTLSLTDANDLLKIHAEMEERCELVLEVQGTLDIGAEVELVLDAPGLAEMVIPARVSRTLDGCAAVVPELSQSLDDVLNQAVEKHRGLVDLEGVEARAEDAPAAVTSLASKSVLKPLVIRNEFMVLLSLELEAQDFVEVAEMLDVEGAFTLDCGPGLADGDRVEFALGVQRVGEVTFHVKVSGHADGDTLLVPEGLSEDSQLRWDRLLAQCRRLSSAGEELQAAQDGESDGARAPEEVGAMEAQAEPGELTAERDDAQDEGWVHDMVWRPVIIRNQFMSLVSLSLDSPDEFVMIDRQLGSKNEIKMAVEERF
jgi:hypothetical protein